MALTWPLVGIKISGIWNFPDTAYLVLHPVWQLPYVSSFHTVLLEATRGALFIFFQPANRIKGFLPLRLETDIAWVRVLSCRHQKRAP